MRRRWNRQWALSLFPYVSTDHVEHGASSAASEAIVEKPAQLGTVDLVVSTRLGCVDLTTVDRALQTELAAPHTISHIVERVETKVIRFVRHGQDYTG